MREFTQRDGVNETNEVYFLAEHNKKLSFTGKDIIDKTYRISVKEILDGKITMDSTFFDSKASWDRMDVPDFFKTVSDTIFTVSTNSHLMIEDSSKLKIQFIFPRFMITRYFDAISSKEPGSSLTVWSRERIFDEKFYSMVFIQPSEVKFSNLIKSRDVETVGKKSDVENWGNELGIEHYWVFELELE